VTDPHAVLGIAPGAPPDELTAAYRDLAKRWHPDANRALPAAEAERRMAEINSAYDLLRSEVWQQRASSAAAPAGPAPADEAVPRRRPAGWWLEPGVRRALGPELLAVLHPDEEVRLVTPVAAWASPQALLAVTARRLVWLLDDAVTGRVRSLDLAAITGVDVRLSWPRRRTAVLRVARRDGRRPISFSDLRPETAGRIAELVRGRAGA
jgi:hypothetical protein